MVEPPIQLEESTAPGRAPDLDVYADDVRLGSLRSRNEWEAALRAWAAFLTEAEWGQTRTVVHTEEIANLLHIHALYSGRVLERVQKMKPRSDAAAKALAVLKRHRHELDDAVMAIGVPPPGEEWRPMPRV